jgi:hypothetical protein
MNKASKSKPEIAPSQQVEDMCGGLCKLRRSSLRPGGVFSKKALTKPSAPSCTDSSGIILCDLICLVSEPTEFGTFGDGDSGDKTRQDGARPLTKTSRTTPRLRPVGMRTYVAPALFLGVCHFSISDVISAVYDPQCLSTLCPLLPYGGGTAYRRCRKQRVSAQRLVAANSRGLGL